MISSSRVNQIFMDSMFSDEKVTLFEGEGIKGSAILDGVKSAGIMASVIFNREKLETHREEITSFLFNLPDPFMKSKGGGWSFLEACMDKNDTQWGEHSAMDQLFMLGQAIGRVSCLLPREMWNALPGGMPYYVVDDSPMKEEN